MPKKKPLSTPENGVPPEPTESAQDMIPDGEDVDLTKYGFSIGDALMLYGLRALKARHDTPERAAAWKAIQADFGRRQAQEEREKRQQANSEEMSTITGLPRVFSGDYDEHMMRVTWAMFGQLVASGTIRMPNFDHADHEDIVKAADDVHSVVMSLYLDLTSVFHEGNRIP